MNWEKLLKRDKKYLNLGSALDIHPKEKYKYYVGIGLPKVGAQMTVCREGKKSTSSYFKNGAKKGKKRKFYIHHDLHKSFPLPKDCIDRIHSEDCFEHIEEIYYPSIFNEIFRILKPKGFFRLAVPDYFSTKSRFCLKLGYDPRFAGHVTLTTYPLLKAICEGNSWGKVKFLHYWKDKHTFIYNKIDYKKGWVKRTVDHKEGKNFNKKKPQFTTSLVVDLIK